MAVKHGIYASEKATTYSNPVTAASGVPIAFGTSPVQTAEDPAAVGIPVLCESLSEFVEKFGWSDDWTKYTLCEVAYSQFVLYGAKPAIFVNLLDPTSMKTAVPGADADVASHLIELSEDVIDSTALVVKAQGGEGNAYVKGTDYKTYYADGKLYVELMSTGACYNATKLNVAYDKTNSAAVTTAVVAAGLESVEYCATNLGMTPDLLLAPGYSQDATVAAAMALKAASLNGMFKAKALIDLDTTSATTVATAKTKKVTDSLTDKAEIVCWPLPTFGGKTYHMSTHLAGLMAQVDTANDGCPVESPSNKALKCDGLVLANGTEVMLTHAQANALAETGIVTALNFMGGWVAWGNYTAAKGSSNDVKDYFISHSRMFDWVNNTVIRTFWNKLDKPMNRRLVDSITDDVNIWMNGLTGRGFLLGGRAEYAEEENTMEDLMQGIVKIHVYLTPAGPAQEINFILEYDADYVSAAFSE